MKVELKVTIVMTLIAIYCLVSMLSLKGDNKFLQGRIISADKINFSQAVTIDELRAKAETKEVVFSSEMPALPSLNGMEAPKR